MTTFRTDIIPTPFPFKIDYESTLFFIGSCFSDNIGQILQDHIFTTINNPFGVLYNPISIQKSLDILLQNKLFETKDLFFHQGQYHSFSHHSRFSFSQENKVLEAINKQTDKAASVLANADVLFITFGSAFVYEHLSSQDIVSNCHKIPSKNFKRYRLGIGDIVKAYKKIIPSLQALNPSVKIVFTVSPVRHWKDGAHENQLSKSTLLLAIEQLCNYFENTYYFPSYELLMDDLRDYRFYADDMLHPSNQAIDYIYRFFSDTFYTSQTKDLEKQIVRLVKATQHLVFDKSTVQYQDFVISNRNKIQQLQKQYPFLNLQLLKDYWALK